MKHVLIIQQKTLGIVMGKIFPLKKNCFFLPVFFPPPSFDLIEILQIFFFSSGGLISFTLPFEKGICSCRKCFAIFRISTSGEGFAKCWLKMDLRKVLFFILPNELPESSSTFPPASFHSYRQSITREVYMLRARNKVDNKQNKQKFHRTSMQTAKLITSIFYLIDISLAFYSLFAAIIEPKLLLAFCPRFRRKKTAQNNKWNGEWSRKLQTSN